MDGALIVAAEEAEINGSVGGNVYILAPRLDLRGELARALHFAGGALFIHAEARWLDEGADLLAATLHTELLPGARLPGDYLGIGYQLSLAGEVAGSVHYDGSRVALSGAVGEDLRATVGDAQTAGLSQLQPLVNLLPSSLQAEVLTPGLTMTEAAAVGGELVYRAPRPAELPGKVAGGARHIPISLSTTTLNAPPLPGDQPLIGPRYWRNVLREFVVLTIIAGGVFLLAARPLHDALRHMQQRPLPSLGVGLLTFILSFPIALLIALASALILLPLNWLGSDLLLYGALLVGMVDFGLASLFYFGAIFLSRVVTAVALGRFLGRRWGRMRRGRRVGNGTRTTGLTLFTVLAGCLALALLSSLPYAGWAFNAFAAFFGLGAIVGSTRGRLRVLRLPAPAPSRYETTKAVAGPDQMPPSPPPIPSDRWRAQPGMSNLPPGFQWWGDEAEGSADDD